MRQLEKPLPQPEREIIMKQTVGPKKSEFRGRPLGPVFWMIFWMLLFTPGFFPSQAHAAIPEAETVIYGKVVNTDKSTRVPITSGTLKWTLRGKEGDRQTYTFTTDLECLQCMDDPPSETGECGECAYSYQLKVPHEALTGVSGFDATVSAVPVTGAEMQYDHTEISLNGRAARITPPAQGYIKAAQSRRASVYRVDLEIGSESELEDTDGDGIPDFWEDQYGLDKYKAEDAAEDPDNDGWNNLLEYLNNTDPFQSNTVPALETREPLRLPENGLILANLYVLDSDSAREDIDITFADLPACADLIFKGGMEPNASGIRQDKLLQANDAMTLQQIHEGRLLLKYKETEQTSCAFKVSISDEDPAHTPAQGTIEVSIWKPSASDGTGARYWTDIHHDFADASDGQIATRLSDRSGSNAFGSVGSSDTGTISKNGTPSGITALNFGRDTWFDLPGDAPIFSSAETGFFAVFQSTGSGEQSLISTAHFQLGVTGDEHSTHPNQIRFGAPGDVMYGGGEVQDQWTLAFIDKSPSEARIELNGVVTAGPFRLEAASETPARPQIGSKTIQEWNSDENAWIEETVEGFQGRLGEMILFDSRQPFEKKWSTTAYLMSKWFGYAVQDASRESRPVNIRGASAGFSETYSEYTGSYVPLYGKDLNYLLIGGFGDDTLTGGHEDDILVGNPGEDLLRGMGGRDLFVVNDGNIIADFNQKAGDRLSIAHLLKGSDQDLAAYVHLETDGTDTLLMIDEDGDGSGYTDATITLKNIALQALDISRFWASGSLVTGGRRPSLTARIDPVQTTASEIGGGAATFTLTFAGDAVPNPLAVPLEIEGNPLTGLNYRMETEAYDPVNGAYETIEIRGSSIPVSLKPGERRLTVSVYAVDNQQTDPDRSLVISLMPNEDSYSLSDADTVTLKIIEGADRISILATQNYTTEDGDLPGEFTISREGQTDVERIVKLNIQGSAENGKDYEFIPSEIRIPQGSSLVKIAVNPYMDILDEPIEYVEVILQAGDGYAATSSSSAMVAIGPTLIPGDLDAKNGVTLADAILGLQVLAGMTPASAIYRVAEVNGDGRIGHEEIIYILQVVSNLRPETER